MRLFRTVFFILPALAALGLSACGDGLATSSDASPKAAAAVADAASGARAAKPREYLIQNGPNASQQALIAFYDAREGDTIRFEAGTYDMPTGLIISGKRGLTVKGAGMEQTILSFKNSDSAEGINASHSDGLVIQGLTVEDTPGNGIRVFRSQYVTIRDVKARWRDAAGRDETQEGYTPLAEHGAYGLYPVETRHVLLENCQAHGASDAGIYVGQTSDVVVRNCLATYNVAGFEFENTFRAVFEDNVATKNVGGFLVFDLPNLRQYGARNIVRRNKSYENNTDNFAPVGNIVGLCPRGTGMLILASDQLEVYDNEIHDNDTLGIAVINYGLPDPAQPDKRYDFFPEGIFIHSNKFRDNGGNVQQPDPERGTASFLPLIIQLKNAGASAHIIWDGAVDKPNDCTDIPKDPDGIPLTLPNPNWPHEEQGGRTDDRGRPNVTREDPTPTCKWNQWKFDAQGKLKLPENNLCLGLDNQFENTKPGTALTSKFLRANLTSSETNQLALDLLRPASHNMKPFQCGLPRHEEPTLDLPFVPDPSSDQSRPDPAQVRAVCNGGQPGQINHKALLEYDCPRLDQYNLFENDQNPRVQPRGTGLRYELNTPLFSDYAVKYRFLFVPKDKPIVYQDVNHTPSADVLADPDYGVAGGGAQQAGSAQTTLLFPVGTVIAKTFAFRVDGPDGKRVSENVVETRLLIKRKRADGSGYWVGLPYIWTTNAQGKRIAELKIEGGTASVAYDYLDDDAGVKGADGKRKRYTGTVPNYRIPAALNCLTCHSGDNREQGTAPIGPKVRNMNRDWHYPDVGSINQLAYLAQKGLLVGLPEDSNGREKMPRWNVPGSTGFLPDSTEDKHARMRAYLETNCMHCHHSNGAASNSSLYLDSLRVVNQSYGICKKPVAAGRGSGDRLYDIIPQDANGSIMPFRVGSVVPGIKMPPIARSVVHGEAASLLGDWIDNVLPTPDTENEEVCSGSGGGPLGFPADVPAIAKAYGLKPQKLTSNDQRKVAD